MAVNNHFFFNCITPLPEPPVIKDSLKTQLEADFSSIDTLRADFIATANAMFGPGFVWLVKSTDGAKFKILVTYLAGSPFPGAHYRRQAVDMNTENMTDWAMGEAGKGAGQEYKPKDANKMPEKRQAVPGAVRVVPVLCVNTWEHVYLTDWGVDGKKNFLEAWWSMIDWDVVANNADPVRT